MKYDFTTIMDRRGMDAVAVDCPPGQPKEGFDLIPMWIADMNFNTAPSIPEAIIERTKHAVTAILTPVTNILMPLSTGRRTATVLPVWNPSTSAMPTVFWAVWSVR